MIIEVGNEKGRLSESSEDVNFQESQVESVYQHSTRRAVPRQDHLEAETSRPPSRTTEPEPACSRHPQGARVPTPAVAMVRLSLLGFSPETGRLRVLTQMCVMSSAVSLSARQGIVAFPSSRRTLQQKTTACPSP